jgi:hypothetical protein
MTKEKYLPENKNIEDKKTMSITNAERIRDINIYSCSLVLPYRLSLFWNSISAFIKAFSLKSGHNVSVK